MSDVILNLSSSLSDNGYAHSRQFSHSLFVLEQLLPSPPHIPQSSTIEPLQSHTSPGVVDDLSTPEPPHTPQLSFILFPKLTPSQSNFHFSGLNKS